MTFRLFRGASALSYARRAAGERHVRIPHHTASVIALTGRLSASRTDANSPHAYVIDAGEVILANRGILILQDFPEFSYTALEMLAGIYRLQRIKLCQGQVSVEIPLYFDVFATAASCPCGLKPDKSCRCSAEHINRFETRLHDIIGLFLLEAEDGDDDLEEGGDPEARSLWMTYGDAQGSAPTANDLYWQ